MGEGASQIIEDHSNRNLLRPRPQEICTAQPHIVTVEDENLDVDGLLGSSKCFFEGTEEHPAIEEVTKFTGEGCGKTKFVEASLEFR